LCAGRRVQLIESRAWRDSSGQRAADDTPAACICNPSWAILVHTDKANSAPKTSPRSARAYRVARRLRAW
jgi:hypothetical protein